MNTKCSKPIEPHKLIHNVREERRNIKRIKTSIIKMEHYRISKLLNASLASKFVKKNGSKQMIYQTGNILLIKI